ncbi:unnamed protein product [Diatraea saccharalis]|uniref:Uncharacterized protein n=1 Tax=Diatraea saccharalis TaxID=40085 RepID=A0A9N9WG95_9NEOP|nr:unnamed protein product [Diatraea saccharalis]
MARLTILFTVILQISLIYANIDIDDDDDQEQSLRHVLKNKPIEEPITEFRSIDTEWMDLFTLPKNTAFPSTSSAAKMAQVLNTDKTAEQQLEDMKEMANEITLSIQNEIAHLLSLALKNTEKELQEHNSRKKRSPESPVDCTRFILRLLNHIKLCNEHQNIAIEKMMTAQQIADKFGIEFTPDPDIFSELAIASSKQTEDLANILQDAYKTKNITNEIEFIPLEEEPIQNPNENNTYYVYSTHVPKEQIAEQLETPPQYEFIPEHIDSQLPVSHIHYEPTQYSYYFNIPLETQIPAPVHAPVSYMPKFYEPPMFTPMEHHPHYYPEPITKTTTIILPIDEPKEPEPELIGEEFEETVTSKVMVDRGDEPGSSTVNHVMTYTISEKSHFRTPQIENLPQQMQYYFFLM